MTDLQFQKDLGLYATAVSEWKNGKSKSYMKHLPKIAKYFDVSVDYLLGNTNMENPTLDEQLDGVDFALAGELRDLTDEGIKLIIMYNLTKEAPTELHLKDLKSSDNFPLVNHGYSYPNFFIVGMTFGITIRYKK